MASPRDVLRKLRLQVTSIELTSELQAWSTTALSFDGLEDRAWSVVSNRQEGSAPHDVTSFDDATGDLPGFDIADPAVVEGPSLRPWPQFGHDVVGQSNFKFHVGLLQNEKR